MHTTGIFYYAWILVYLGPLLALTIWFVPSWRGFDRQTRKELAVTAIVYLCGAVVMEMLGGAYDEAFGKHPPLVWGLLVAVEESLEMAGLILLARTLLRLLGPAAGGRAVLFEQAD